MLGSGSLPDRALPFDVIFAMISSELARLPRRELLLSTLTESPESPELDARGLSKDLLPGILVRRADRKERVDSFVSDLLNDGYESKLGPGPVGVWEPEPRPSFDGWFPMTATWCDCNLSASHPALCLCPPWCLFLPQDSRALPDSMMDNGRKSNVA